MKCTENITTDNPIAICRAASAYISAGNSGTCMFGLNLCDSVSDVLELVEVAYGRLPPPEQALFAPTLMELTSLALVERALELRG